MVSEESSQKLVEEEETSNDIGIAALPFDLTDQQASEELIHFAKKLIVDTKYPSCIYFNSEIFSRKSW